MSMKTPPSVRRAKRDASAMLGRFTWMQVAMGRNFGHDDEKIKTDVREALKEAFACTKPFVKDFDTGLGKPEPCVNPAGLFRIAINEFHLEHADRFERDMWAGVVERHLADALSHEGRDFGADSFKQGA